MSFSESWVSSLGIIRNEKCGTNPDLHRERTEVHHVFKNLHSKKLSQITIPAEGEGT